MFELQFEMSGNMDIDSAELEIECPKCDFYNPIWVKQARLKDMIICRGCKVNIQLNDSMNEVRKARRSVLKAVKDLKQEFEKLNREMSRF